MAIAEVRAHEGAEPELGTGGSVNSGPHISRAPGPGGGVLEKQCVPGTVLST